MRRHHRSERVVWLVFDRRGISAPALSYDDALDEALCFGWIDSLVRRIDDRSYARKFTPRARTTRWSARNVDRLRRLLAAGRVRAAGRAAVPAEVLRTASRPRGPARAPERRSAVPSELASALAAAPVARAFFDSLAPSYRGTYVRWVAAAKQAGTRERRAREAARLLGAGTKRLLK